MIKKIIRGTGKRKCSIAQVSLMLSKDSNKESKILIKSKNILEPLSIEEYFPNSVFIRLIKEVLFLTKSIEKYDIFIKVSGGGFSGQASACRAGIAKILANFSSENKNILGSSGFLTRDSRIKERKKCGLKKARKAPQFSKR